MSSAVLDRPPAGPVEPAWVILDDAPLSEHMPRRHGVEIRGRGRDQYGAIGRGGVNMASPNLVALPSVDELD